MKQIKNPGLSVISCLAILLLSSCFGMSMDIELRQNGSGTLSLEYQVSKSLESLGKLDGNERWNTIPVGRSDFERTLSRLPGMKLLSFSSKEDQKNVVINAKMDFSSIQDLLDFLDSGGRRSSFSGDAGSGRILLTLSEGAGINNSGLEKLIEDISASYSIKMSMRFPGEGSLSVFDNSGRPLETQTQGKNVSCAFPLYTILSSANGIHAEFKW